MTSMIYFTDELSNQEYVILTHEDGTQTSMLKEYYEEQQKASELGGTL